MVGDGTYLPEPHGFGAPSMCLLYSCPSYVFVCVLVKESPRLAGRTLNAAVLEQGVLRRSSIAVAYVLCV